MPRATPLQAERCDVELGELWKSAGVKMADLLIATERAGGGCSMFFFCFDFFFGT